MLLNSLHITVVLIFVILTSNTTANPFGNSKRFDENFGLDEVKYISNPLRKSLTYVRNHTEAKTLDVALGVMLAKGNLMWINDRLREKFHGGKILCDVASLLRMCHEILRDSIVKLKRSDSRRDRVFALLFEYHLDGFVAEDLKYGNLDDEINVDFPELKNCSSIKDYSLRGTPNDSDACILELISDSCNASDNCRFQETNHMDNFGYKTTHRLLYFQVAGKLQCDRGDPPKKKEFDMMKKSLCDKIMKEAVILEAKFLRAARDLFLEQIALCGFEGYVEFARKKWMDVIPKWQTSVGCFGLLPDERVLRRMCSEEFDSNVRIRRDDSVLNDFCHTHVTAVAVSAMAFHLRVALSEF